MYTIPVYNKTFPHCTSFFYMWSHVLISCYTCSTSGQHHTPFTAAYHCCKIKICFVEFFQFYNISTIRHVSLILTLQQNHVCRPPPVNFHNIHIAVFDLTKMISQLTVTLAFRIVSVQTSRKIMNL